MHSTSITLTANVNNLSTSLHSCMILYDPFPAASITLLRGEQQHPYDEKRGCQQVGWLCRAHQANGADFIRRQCAPVHLSDAVELATVASGPGGVDPCTLLGPT
jgi:hypothetical protein